MFERRRERARAAEEFLRGTQTPRAPQPLRDFGLQRIVARATTAGEAAKERRYLRHPARLRRAVLIPVFTLLVMTVGTSGLYAASAGALPGSPLYGSKIFFERARLAFTPSPSSDAGLEMEYCQRRMRELQEMLRGGGPRDWERWLKEYRRNLSRADSLLESIPEAESRSLSLRFESTLSEQLRFMEETLAAGAPDEILPFLEEAYMECHGRMMRARARCGMEGGGGSREQEGEPGGPGGGGTGYPQRQEYPSSPGGCTEYPDSGCSWSNHPTVPEGEPDRVDASPQEAEGTMSGDTGNRLGCGPTGVEEGDQESTHGPFPGRHVGM